ncbi:hypothetical protein [Paractinoplanes deccanensis]|nr:hypothetical protein [Actinoplanes deccanensis]
MERRRSAGKSWTASTAIIIGSFLVGAFFLVAAVLVFSGAVTVAGWGEGTIAQRVVVGLLAAAVGGVTLAGAGMGLREGSAGTRPAGDARPVRTGPFLLDVRDEDGYGHRGFGIEPPVRWRDGSGSGTHPGVGEF